MIFFERNQFEVAFCEVFQHYPRIECVTHLFPSTQSRRITPTRFAFFVINVSSMTVRNPMDRLKSEFLWRICDPAVDPNRWAQQTLHSYREDPFFLDNHMQLRRLSCRSGSGLKSHV